MERRLVWLACQSNEAAAAGNRETPSDAKLFLEAKLRRLFDSTPSVASKLASHMPPPPVDSADQNKVGVKTLCYRHVEAIRQACSKCIVGLAIVEVAAAYEGLLSTLDLEQRALLFLSTNQNNRVGSVLFRVLDAIPLSEPQQPIVSGVKSYANHKSFVMTVQGVEHLMSSLVPPGEETVEQFLSAWAVVDEYQECIRELGEEDPGPMCAMVLAPQVSLLIARGFLSHFWFGPTSRFAPHPYLNPLLAQVRQQVRSYALGSGSDDAEAAKILETECMNMSGTGLDRDMLLGIANSLREHLRASRSAAAHVNLPAGEAQDSEGALLELQKQIVWMEGFYRATEKDQIAKSRLQRSSKGFQGVWDDDLGCRVTYKPAFLLQCVVLSFQLRSSGAVPDVIQQAVRCLPQVWRESLMQLLATAKNPSPSTLSRARLSVDAAFMLWMRKRHAELLEDAQVTLFFKVDSTPLGGNNWEVVEYQLIKGTDLVSAGKMAASLVDLGAKCSCREASLQDCPCLSATMCCH